MALKAGISESGESATTAATAASITAHESVTVTAELPLIETLSTCSTSKSWSTLDAVANKMSRRLGRAVTPRQLDAAMVSIGDAALLQLGIWRKSFGTKYMPIICINPSFRLAIESQRTTDSKIQSTSDKPNSSSAECSCHQNQSRANRCTSNDQNSIESHKRFFGSHDYNAGRHKPDRSVHKPNCVLWRPPTSGHLHSWRRPFS
jgi:hypothetical protein